MSPTKERVAGADPTRPGTGFGNSSAAAERAGSAAIEAANSPQAKREASRAVRIKERTEKMVHDEMSGGHFARTTAPADEEERDRQPLHDGRPK